MPKRGSAPPATTREQARARVDSVVTAATVSPAAALSAAPAPAVMPAPAAAAIAAAPLGEHQLSVAAQATIARLRKNTAAARLFEHLKGVDTYGVPEKESWGDFDQFGWDDGSVEDEPPRVRVHTRSTSGELYHVLTTALAEARGGAIGAFKEAAEGYTGDSGLMCSYERRVAWEGDTKYRFVRGSLWRFFVTTCDPNNPKEMRLEFGADTVLFFPAKVTALRALGGDDSSSHRNENDMIVLRSAADVRSRAGALAAWVRRCVSALESVPAHNLAGSCAWKRNEIRRDVEEEAMVYYDDGKISSQQLWIAHRRIWGMFLYDKEPELLPHELEKLVAAVSAAGKSAGGWERLCRSWGY